MYVASGDALELHRGPDGALRGYLRSEGRIAALNPVEVRDGTLRATATAEDGTRSEVLAKVTEGPVLMLGGRAYRRSATERPGDATVRREIEEAYARLARAVSSRDHDAFQSLRIPEFATIPPDGVPKSGAGMAERARGLLQRIQPPVRTTNDILELTVRGDDAIAVVRQKFTRRQPVDAEGTLHEIHTEVTQRETWTRTPQGWKLSFVDDEVDPLREDRGPTGVSPR
jgi:ketosteroid isomerase-like protein